MIKRLMLIVTICAGFCISRPVELKGQNPRLPWTCGDANASGTIDISDAVYLINYIFGGGSTPIPLESGNANNDCGVNVADAAYLCKYIFGGGPAPSGCSVPVGCNYGTVAGNKVRMGCRPYSGNNDSVAIPIYIDNTVGLNGFSLGFHYASNDIEITSVSSTGSIIPGGSLQKKFVPASNKVLVGWIDIMASQPINPQNNGLLFTLYARILAGSPTQFIDLDSAFVGPAGDFMFSTVPGGPIRPAYVKCEPGFDVVTTTDTVDVFYVRQADLDQDNYADIVYTGRTDDSLYVIYGKSDGTFEAPRNYLKVKQAALAVGYVDSDSLLDIVAHTTDKIYILLNQGSRNFAIDSQTVSYSSSAIRSLNSTVFPAIAAGYFNRDAYLDLIVSENQILYGNGTGAFPTSATLTFSFDAVDAADFNNDGYDDFVATIGDSAKMFLNDGSGNLTRSAAVRIGYRAFDFATVKADIDLNGDRKRDFVAVTGNSTLGDDTSVVTVCLGDGSGGIANSDTLAFAGTLLNLALSDVEKDGDLDVSAVNAKTRALVICKNDGLGNLTPQPNIPLGSGTSALYALVAGDLDRSGAPDFAIGGQQGNPIVLAINGLPADPILPDEMVTTGYGNVTLRIVNPLNLVISRPLQTVAGSAYGRLDANGDDTLDERAFDYNLQYGGYRIIVEPRSDTSNGTLFEVGIRIDGTTSAHLADCYRIPPRGDSLVFYYDVEPVSLVHPANGRALPAARPIFNWSGLAQKSMAADSFQFQLDRYLDFRAPICDIGGLTTATYTPTSALGIDSVFYWRVRSFQGGVAAPYSHPYAVYVIAQVCGDANGDGATDISDVVALIAYIFSGGPAPIPQVVGDANCDGFVDISDAVYIISYIFSGGPAPCAACK